MLCLAWAPFGHRMDELAEIVGGVRVSLTVLYGPRYLAPIRYLALTFWTLLVLFVRAPDVVYAQNPPVFCPLASLLYCRMANARLVIDHHSIWSVKTFGNSLLSRAIGMLERFVARAAHANTVPHAVWGRMLEEMNARNVGVIHDFVRKNRHARDDSIRKRYSLGRIMAIASHGGHPLERIEEEAAAVALNGSVTLLVTGPPEKLRHRIGERLPANVRYLGLLEREEYEKLKASADFAVNVTDEPYTLSHVLFEYAASSIPVISTRQTVVEQVFGDSLLYVDSSRVQDVADRIFDFTKDDIRRLYTDRILRKYAELEAESGVELRKLKEVVFGGAERD